MTDRYVNENSLPPIRASEWFAALDASGASKPTLNLARAVMPFAHLETGRAICCGRTAIAEVAGRSPDAVGKGMARLADKGWLVRTGCYFPATSEYPITVWALKLPETAVEFGPRTFYQESPGMASIPKRRPTNEGRGRISRRVGVTPLDDKLNRAERNGGTPKMSNMERQAKLAELERKRRKPVYLASPVTIEWLGPKGEPISELYDELNSFMDRRTRLESNGIAFTYSQ